MKIQKKYQGAIPLNRIANEHNESDINTYSTSYINNNLPSHKNLFHLQLCTSEHSTITYISDNEFTMAVDASYRGILYVAITNLKPNTTYTFSYDVVNSNSEATPGIDGYWVTDSGEEIYNTDLSGYPTSFTFNTNEYTTIHIRMYISYAFVETVGTFSNIQLEEGDKRTDFSPTYMIERGEIYSYLERKVGFWINGKPIYRKVIWGTSPEVSTAVVWAPNSLPNIDTCTNIYAMVKALDGKGEPKLWVRDCCINAIDVNTVNNGIACCVNNVDYYGLDMFVVVEYTKTTDKAII